MNCGFEDVAKLESRIAGGRNALAQLLVDHGGSLARRQATRLQHNPFIDFSVEDDLEHHADPMRYHDNFFADVYINDVSITSFHSGAIFPER